MACGQDLACGGTGSGPWRWRALPLPEHMLELGSEELHWGQAAALTSLLLLTTHLLPLTEDQGEAAAVWIPACAALLGALSTGSCTHAAAREWGEGMVARM